MGHASLTEKDVTFTNVAWGRTATVFGPENVDHATINLEPDRSLRAIIIKSPPGAVDK